VPSYSEIEFESYDFSTGLQCTNYWMKNSGSRLDSMIIVIIKTQSACTVISGNFSTTGISSLMIGVRETIIQVSNCELYPNGKNIQILKFSAKHISGNSCF
jgi:hypothetical protein